MKSQQPRSLSQDWRRGLTVDAFNPDPVTEL